MVGAEIDGLAITELLAEEGDTVTRGQVLARLSRDMLDAQVAQNAASLSRRSPPSPRPGTRSPKRRPTPGRPTPPSPAPAVWWSAATPPPKRWSSGKRGAGDARPRPGGRRRPAPCPVRQGNGGSAAARNSRSALPGPRSRPRPPASSAGATPCWARWRHRPATRCSASSAPAPSKSKPTCRKPRSPVSASDRRPWSARPAWNSRCPPASGWSRRR